MTSIIQTSTIQTGTIEPSTIQTSTVQTGTDESSSAPGVDRDGDDPRPVRPATRPGRQPSAPVG